MRSKAKPKLVRKKTPGVTVLSSKGLPLRIGGNGRRAHRAIFGTITAFAQYGVQLLLQLLLAPIVLELAGQNTLGAYAIVMQIVGLLTLTDLGFSLTATRFLANAFGCEDCSSRFMAIMSSGRIFLFASNAVLALLAVILALRSGEWFHLDPFLEIEVRHGLLAIAIWSLARTPLSLAAEALAGVQDLGAINIIGIFGNLTRFLMSIFLLLSGLNLLGLILAYLIGSAVTMILGFIRYLRIFSGQRRFSFSPNIPVMKELISFGASSFLITISWRFVTGIDNLVVGALAGTTAAAVYFTTQTPAVIVYALINRLADSVGPAINELWALGDRSTLKHLFLSLQRMTFLLAIPFVVGLIFLESTFIRLWMGDSLFSGQFMAWLLGIFVLFVTLGHCLLVFLMASGQIRVFSVISLGEGIFNLVLSILLGTLIGIQGVMLATVITHLPTFIYLLWKNLNLWEVGFKEYFENSLAPCLFPFLIIICCAIIFTSFINPETWMGFSILCCGVMSPYVASVALFSLEPREVAFLRKNSMVIIVKITDNVRDIRAQFRRYWSD